MRTTAVGGTTERYSLGGDGYDAHGNMRRMPHLPVMEWDFRDQLRMTTRQAVSPPRLEPLSMTVTSRPTSDNVGLCAAQQ